jgi:hypothetical protein
MPNKNWKREKTVIDQKTDSDRVLDRVIDQKTDSDRVIDQKTDTTVTRFLGLPGLYSPFPPLFLPPPPAESPLLPAGLAKKHQNAPEPKIVVVVIDVPRYNPLLTYNPILQTTTYLSTIVSTNRPDSKICNPNHHQN